MQYSEASNLQALSRDCILFSTLHSARFSIISKNKDKIKTHRWGVWDRVAGGIAAKL